MNGNDIEMNSAHATMIWTEATPLFYLLIQLHCAIVAVTVSVKIIHNTVEYNFLFFVFFCIFVRSCWSRLFIHVFSLVAYDVPMDAADGGTN